MNKGRLLRSFLISWAVAAIMLPACSTNATIPAHPPELDSTVLPHDLSAVTYPLDEYVSDVERSGRVELAWNVLVVRCLAEFGFDVDAGEPNAVPVSGLEERYGLVDENAARSAGYHRTVEPDGEEPLMLRLPAGARAVFNGQGPKEYQGRTIPEDGCAGKASGQLIPGADPNFVGELEREARQRLNADERLVALLDDWKGCMRDAGYQYDSLGGPYQVWQGRRGADGPISDEEIATAVADVGCKQETGLLETWIALEIAYQRQVIAENEEQLVQHRRAMDAAAERAREILGSA